MVIYPESNLYVAWNWSTSLWWMVVVGGSGGGWLCEPILVFSFGFDQAEQQAGLLVTKMQHIYWNSMTNIM
jgi:hypothetical protein